MKRTQIREERGRVIAKATVDGDVRVEVRRADGTKLTVHVPESDEAAGALPEGATYDFTLRGGFVVLAEPLDAGDADRMAFAGAVHYWYAQVMGCCGLYADAYGVVPERYRRLLALCDTVAPALEVAPTEDRIDDVLEAAEALRLSVDRADGGFVVQASGAIVVRLPNVGAVRVYLSAYAHAIEAAQCANAPGMAEVIRAGSALFIGERRRMGRGGV